MATARLYFRRAGEDYYAFVNMAFTGVSYCGTLPGPREKAKAIEYYVQAVDDNYQPTRTSTFRLPVQPEGVCEFPPLEKDAAKAAAIKVFGHEPQAGEEARRRLQPDRRHVCPASLALPRPRPGLLAAAASAARARPSSTCRAPSSPSPRASRCASW